MHIVVLSTFMYMYGEHPFLFTYQSIGLFCDKERKQDRVGSTMNMDTTCKLLLQKPIDDLFDYQKTTHVSIEQVSHLPKTSTATNVCNM